MENAADFKDKIVVDVGADDITSNYPCTAMKLCSGVADVVV